MTAAALETAVLRVARALADPTRFRLLRAIAARGELSCRELVARFPVSQATVSHHLRVLADAGLVTARQDGPYHRYRAVDGALEAHARDLRALTAAPDPRRGGREPHRAEPRASPRRPGGRPHPQHPILERSTR
jgi:ArsR family transcriptional regulator